MGFISGKFIEEEIESLKVRFKGLMSNIEGRLRNMDVDLSTLEKITRSL